MSKQRKALELALEAMEDHAKQYPHMQKGYTLDAIEALREALAEPEQEPVAWMCADEDMTRKGYCRFSRNCEGEWNIPVYTTPPARKPLTDSELWEMWVESPSDVLRFARGVELAHGIGD